jgi:hypothetical protein
MQTPWYDLDYQTAWTTLALLRLVLGVLAAGIVAGWVAGRMGRRR